jgi:V/A-type H+-transporting ATPase subunit C
MQEAVSEQINLDFYTYPPVGDDDWRYVYQTAQARVLEMQMLTRATLLDMANSDSFETAADLLSATEYALPRKTLTDLEDVLHQRRTALRELFTELMIDQSIVELFKTRDDFANLRLAVRRMLTEKPLGADYSPDGNVPPEQFEQVFEEENYDLFPGYMQQAVEQAVLAYYQDKDIRRIDYAIDRVQAEYNLSQARRLRSIFLLGLFKIQIDLTNIRTMLRLKFTDFQDLAAPPSVFLRGGFLWLERLEKGLDLGYETLGALFFVTPYHQVIEASAAYVASDKSFLRAEQKCDEFLSGFLRSTIQVTTGHQPIIAYLLLKENEIRSVRLILTAKKNNLDNQLIIDRIS